MCQFTGYQGGSYQPSYHGNHGTELVTQAVVTPKVTPEQRVTELAIIEVNAKMVADSILNQRDDVKRARAIVQKLWAAVESEIDYSVEFEKIGSVLSASARIR